MVDFTVTDLIAEFREQFLARFPALAHDVEQVSQEYGEPSSAFWYLSFVLKPHIDKLLDAHDHSGLTVVGELFEEVATQGPPSVRMDLCATMEELDLWKLYQWLGPAVREQWFEQITWYPEKKDRKTPENAHVQKQRYLDRWREEIAGVGGFEALSTEQELVIRYRLKKEFRIRGLRAPKPGGWEWRGSGLSWPLSPPGGHGTGEG